MESKYPKGLVFLVFTECWERFGYYLMIGIFFLYMTSDGAAGGMGWENSSASDFYGTFIALAYLTPFIKLIFSVIQCSHATVSVFNTNFVQNINGKKLIAHCKEYM